MIGPSRDKRRNYAAALPHHGLRTEWYVIRHCVQKPSHNREWEGRFLKNFKVFFRVFHKQINLASFIHLLTHEMISISSG